MPRTKLNDAIVKALTPPASGQVTHWDTGLPGFGVRIAPGGAKTWIIQYRHAGRVRRFKLGRYPILSLADARDAARDKLASVTKGEDPAGERRAEREAATFGAVAEEYIERHAKAKKRSWREDHRILEHDVLPRWRTRRAKDITARDVRELLDSILDRGAPIQANRTFACIRRIFNWAAAPDRAFVPQFHNPCRGIDRPAPERQRERVLTADELRRFWGALDSEDTETAGLFKLYLLTAQRGGELRGMEWAEVDLDAAWWVIPAEKAKNKLAHRVPLSPQAVAILRGLREGANGSAYVFPHYVNDKYTVYRAADRIRQAAGVDFKPHDLRRTTATFLTSELGVSRLVVSKLLNHVETGVTRVYDRASYDPEKRRAVEAWARRLHAIVTRETVDTKKVVPLRA